MSRIKSFHAWCMENRDRVVSEVEFGADFMEDMQNDGEMPRSSRYEPLHGYIQSLFLHADPTATFVEMYKLYSREFLKPIGRDIDGPCDNKVYDEPEDCDLEPHLMYVCISPAKTGKKCKECMR